MSKEEINNYLRMINNYNDKEYLFSIIAYSAGPTLAREKPSSLLIFNNNNRNVHDSWRKFKEEVTDKFKINFFELKKNKESTVVLIYNETILKHVLKELKNINFLKRFGYNDEMTIDEILIYLSKRFENVCPHEIGIFLGYPIEDVAMFVNCPNKKCKMVGYWKVYHNIEQAKSIFKKYDDIKVSIVRTMMKGIKPMEIISSGSL